MYFLTISAAEGRCIFGEIHGKNTALTPIGEIAKACWIEIPQHFPAIKIETFAVMPNHIHGILTIEPDGTNANLQDKRVVSAGSFGRPTAQSIPAIVRSFKSAATKRARESELAADESIWQRGYYEHVLRSTQEYVKATNYILQNPAQWAFDGDNLNRTPGAENLQGQGMPCP